MKKVLFDLSDRSNMFYWQTNRRISPEEQKVLFLDRRNTVSIEDTKRAISTGMSKAGKKNNDSIVTEIGEPIPFGSVNNVLKATLKDGTVVVVRMHPYHVKNGYFWVEKLATDKAREANIPTYETYWIDDSQTEFDFDYMIMSAVPGKPLQEMWPLGQILDQKLIRQTGAYMAKIHTITTIKYGFFSNQLAKKENNLVGQYDTFKQHLFAGLDEDFTFLQTQKILNRSQIKTIEKIFNLHDDLTTCRSPKLIHNDIADWNELSDGIDITGMMDWDECFSGDPVMDFSQWSLFFDNDRLKYLIEGYQQISPLPEGYQEKDHLFRLRYVISKLHLRKKRAIAITDSTFLNERIKRGVEVLEEELKHFGV